MSSQTRTPASEVLLFGVIYIIALNVVVLRRIKPDRPATPEPSPTGPQTD